MSGRTARWRTTRSMSRRESEKALDALYAELPRLDCQGRCQESCGPILMSRIEWQRIQRRTGQRAPKLRADLTCPFLSAVGRCTVYGVRPMICRLWGLVPSMPCVFGCQPERWLTEEQGREYLRRANEIGR